jgi:HD-GYP domain-containing protein (c-di-GMP phosphodiesterase class II)
MVKRHPTVGYDVLKPVRMLRPEHLEIVRGHHERMDGSGYPDGLRGENVSILTRIIVVADAYDAMASNRAYRPALSRQEIVRQLRDHSGSQFDPDVANRFVSLIEEGALP